MSTEAVPAAAAATTPADGATAPAVEPGAATPPAEGAAKPDAAKPPEAAAAPAKKPAWDVAMRLERKAREAARAADERAKAAEEKAAARVREIEAQAAEIAPLVEAIKAKDARKVFELTGWSMEQVALAIADEDKAPTADEIKAAATADALAKLEAKQAEIAAKEAEARKAREAEEAKAKAAEADARWERAVAGQLDAVTKALADPANAEELADALDADAVYATRAVKDEDTYVYGKSEKGADLEVTIRGGTPIAREATALILKFLQATGERITPAEALKRVQKNIAPALQKTAERRTASASKAKQPDQKKPGGDGQPTLSTRSTTGVPAVDPTDADDGLVGQAAVRRAMIKAGQGHLLSQQ